MKNHQHLSPSDLMHTRTHQRQAENLPVDRHHLIHRVIEQNIQLQDNENVTSLSLSPATEEEKEELMDEWESATEEHDKEWFAVQELEEAKEEKEKEEELKEAKEEWEEATAEHDSEFFEEFEKNHDGDSNVQQQQQQQQGEEIEPTIKSIEEELEQEEEQAEVADAAEDAELEKEGFIDGTAEVDREDENEIIIPDTQVADAAEVEALEEEMTEEEKEEVIDEWNNATEAHDEEFFEEFEAKNNSQNENEASKSPIDGDDKDKLWTGEDEDHDVDSNQVPETPVTTSPSSAPTALATAPVSWKELPKPPSVDFPPTSDCVGFICPIAELFGGNTLTAFTVLGIVPLLLLCCLKRYCCSSKSNDTARGEYRAVAARYGEMGYDDAFADTYSDDDEDDDFVDGYGDIEDDSWGQSGKRAIEMTSLDDERNGGLSLEEMNG